MGKVPPKGAGVNRGRKGKLQCSSCGTQKRKANQRKGPRPRGRIESMCQENVKESRKTEQTPAKRKMGKQVCTKRIKRNRKDKRTSLRSAGMRNWQQIFGKRVTREKGEKKRLAAETSVI